MDKESTQGAASLGNKVGMTTRPATLPIGPPAMPQALHCGLCSEPSTCMGNAKGMVGCLHAAALRNASCYDSNITAMQSLNICNATGGANQSWNIMAGHRKFCKNLHSNLCSQDLALTVQYETTSLTGTPALFQGKTVRCPCQ
eukprot:scaffold23939_cov17-Tisochrysis_lutea.AAC.1